MKGIKTRYARYILSIFLVLTLIIGLTPTAFAGSDDYDDEYYDDDYYDDDEYGDDDEDPNYIYHVSPEVYESLYKDRGYEIIDSTTIYRYRDKVRVTSGKESLSGYTRIATNKISETYSKWGTSKPTAKTVNGEKQKTVVSVESKNVFRAMSHYTNAKTWYWKAKTGGGGTSYPNTLWVYSSVSVETGVKSTRDTDGSYTLPKTIKVGTGTKIGQIYLITTNGNYASSFTSGSNKGVFVWSKTKGYIYRTKTTVTSYTYEKWGAWSQWTPNRYTSSSTRQVETKAEYTLAPPEGVDNPQPVDKIQISDASITVPDAEYYGEECMPEPDVIYNGEFLCEGIDYTLEYSNNNKAGTGKVTIKGINCFSGTVIKTFKIINAEGYEDGAYADYTYEDDFWGADDYSFGNSLSEADIYLAKSNYQYNGKARKPKAEVELEGLTLREGKDYLVSYRNNKKIGTAYVVITGIGEYSDTAEMSFKIVPDVPKLKKVKLSSSGGKTLITIKGAKVKGATSYQLQISRKKNFKNNQTEFKKIKKGKKSIKLKTHLDTNKRYYLRVRAVKKVGGKNIYSKWSKVKQIKGKG